MTLKLNKDVIYGFVGSCLAHRFDDSVKTPSCHLEWWEYCTRDTPIVLIAAPRGHAKSTAITHCYTLASVLFKEHDFVLLVSDTYEQAVMFLADIKSELEDNELIQELFGKMEFEKDAENDCIVRMDDGHKFRILAKGSEQKVRGIKWNHKRPNLIVGDDLENDEIVMNPDRREKFRNWMYKALLPCRAKNGKVRIVGTILHMDSFLERHMPKAWDKTNYVDDGIKITNKRANRAYFAVKYRAHPKVNDYTKILWEGRWPKEKLHDEYHRYVAAGNPEGYVQEYLNNPIDETRAYFRRSDLLPISMEQKEQLKNGQKPLLYYMAADLAISQEERADYTVIVCGGMDSDGILYIVDIIRERMDAKDIVDCLLDMAEKYQPECIAVEQGMIQKSLGAYINAEMDYRNKAWFIVPMLPSKDKETRARGFQGRIRQGKVRFDKGADWYPQLEEELTTFPRGVHDDQVDALAWLGLILNKMAHAPTVEELHEEEFDNEFRLTMGGHDGRSITTGY